MEVVLWGVRGSVPSPSPATQFYGANTSCIEVRTTSGDLLIFDAGSGIRLLGDSLPNKGYCHLFISHGHADHTQGLGFFRPFYNPNWLIDLYVPEWLSAIPERFFDGITFPVAFADLQATVRLHALPAEKSITIGINGDIVVEAFGTEHPGGNLAYKVRNGESVFFYSGDHEITQVPKSRERTKYMLHGANIAIVDALYSRASYRQGWGHSAWEDWRDLAQEAEVNCLLLSHHDPDRTDAELDIIQQELSEHPGRNGCLAYVARESMRITPHQSYFTIEHSGSIQEFIDTLSQYKEEGIILDRILTKTREITQAEAGTVFLVDGDELIFAYAHNDALFSVKTAYKHAYVRMRIPRSMDSIAGYAAVTGNSLNIANAHRLPPGVPYKFNDSFDAKTGYCTESMLVTPFFDHNHKLLGVVQLINSLNPQDGMPQPFTVHMEKSVKVLAREAANILELSNLVKENIHRLLQITMLHDAAETGPHAERVGAITAEVYQRWAEKRGDPLETIRAFRSQLRLAAMLHDIGKVGISDIILKKRGKLTQEEFGVIQRHTEMGAQLFASDSKDITGLAHAIAKHHHQRWDGQGYAGVSAADALAGLSIPLAARAAAIADVFDALVSPRCYKNAWTFDQGKMYVKQQAGRHFDPDLVECFMEIFDTVCSIYQRFPDNTPEHEE